LLSKDISPEACRSFNMIAYGPILPEADSMDEHKRSRNLVAKMEKDLCDALCQAGYQVLNTINCRHSAHYPSWPQILNTFAERFPRLKP
jgi:hypothetical protein